MLTALTFIVAAIALSGLFALNPRELFASADGIGSSKRVFPSSIRPVKFAAGSGTLAPVTPVSFNTNTNTYQVWGDIVATSVYRLTAASTTATDGTFTITVDDETTGALNHDDAAATIQTALEALTSIASGEVYCFDTDGGLASNNGYTTIVFVNRTPDVSVTLSLTGNDHTLSTISTAVGEIAVATAASTTATDGTFTITVNNETTAALDHDTTPAAALAALEALGGISPGDVIVFDTLAAGLGTNSGKLIILFTGNLTYTNPTVTMAFGSLIGNAHVASTLVAGADDYGSKAIDGFVWPDSIVLDSDEEVLGNVMLAGDVHYGDIVLPSGEATESLKAALRSGPRQKGLNIKGLSQVH